MGGSFSFAPPRPCSNRTIDRPSRKIATQSMISGWLAMFCLQEAAYLFARQCTAEKLGDFLTVDALPYITTLVPEAAGLPGGAKL